MESNDERDNLHVKIELEFDLKKEIAAIERSKELNDNEKVFKLLTLVENAKRLVENELDKVLTVESVAKNAINGRAKELYGQNWEVIEGKGYKINRIMSGSVYATDEEVSLDEVDEQFLKVKTELNSKAVDKYIKEHSELPEGIIYNPRRSERIKITV